jgi:hypothetical protein
MTMGSIGNEKGVALVTALMLTLISLGIIMALLYFVTQGVELSAASKKYRTALEASHGGVDVMAAEVVPKLFSAGMTEAILETDLGGITLTTDNYACLQQKAHGGPETWTSCVTTSLLDPKINPDVVFLLQGVPSQGDFKVYGKIVDTISGNTSGGGSESGLASGAAVVGSNLGANTVTPMHIPFIFRIELQGERKDNPDERAQLSVLYAY